MADTKEQEETAGELGALTEQLRLRAEKDAKDALRDDAMAKMEARIAELTEKMATQDRYRKSEFIEDDIDRLRGMESEHGTAATIKAMAQMRSTKPEVVELQTELDNLYVLGSLLCEDSKNELTQARNVRKAVRETKYYEAACRRHPLLRRVKDLSTTEGDDWIPVGLSATVHEQVRLQLQVAGLFTRFNMPTNPYNWPIQHDPIGSYYAAERGGADDEINDASPKKVPAAEFTMTKAQFDAKKHGTRVVISAELNEDTIVPMLQYIREEMVRGLAEGQEDTTLNGRVTGGTLDTDSTGATHRRRMWNGLRFYAKNAATAWNAVTAAGSIQIGDLRKMSTLMGKYALYPRDTTLIASPKVFNQLLTLTDAAGNPLVVTRDKYGNAATIVTGEVAQLFGQPIVITGQGRENLNRFGFYDGTTPDSSVLLQVNAREFKFGDWRQPTIKSKEIIDTDQFAIVLLQRLDFVCFRPTGDAAGVPVGGVYAIRS